MLWIVCGFTLIASIFQILEKLDVDSVGSAGNPVQRPYKYEKFVTTRTKADSLRLVVRQSTTVPGNDTIYITDYIIK